MENIFPASNNNNNNNTNNSSNAYNTGNKRQPFAKHPKSPVSRSPTCNSYAQNNQIHADLNAYSAGYYYPPKQQYKQNSPPPPAATYQNQRYTSNPKRQQYNNATVRYSKQHAYSPSAFQQPSQKHRRRRFNSNYRPYTNDDHDSFNSNNRAKQARTAYPSTVVAAATASHSIDFSRLPNVVLAKVYSCLSLTDRLNASASCRSWRASLYNPCLWHDQPMLIYLLNKWTGVRSAHFKTTLAKYTNSLSIRYDPGEPQLVETLVSIVGNLKDTSSNLRRLTLTPVPPNDAAALMSYNEETEYYNYYHGYNNHHHHYQTRSAGMSTGTAAASTRIQHFNKLNESLFQSLNQLVLGAKCFEHLALGFLSDMCRGNANLIDLLLSMSKRHLFNLKSLHIATIKSSAYPALTSKKHNGIMKSLYDQAATGKTWKVCEFGTKNGTVSSCTTANDEQQRSDVATKFQVSNLLCQFVNLTLLSIDYEDLSNEFLKSTVCLLSLKKLNIIVNSLDCTNNDLDHCPTDESWQALTNRNKTLRVRVCFLAVEETIRNYQLVLRPAMPLETLRMYFCKSLSPEMLQYLSNNFSETLTGLVVVDQITEPTLRYHNALRYDADPDPLVLLCWKCKCLGELVLIGYEILEINLIAIAKLRGTQLTAFYIPQDCVMDLRYGHFRNNAFVEDDDGEDTMVDYGFCSYQVIDKVCSILANPDWHPLEKNELPVCVCDYAAPFEEAYLDTILGDQIF